MNKDEALKMAIEFIEMHLTTNERTFIERTATLEACKEALAQPAQEPVATLKITSLGEYDLTLNVPTELHYKALIDAVGIGNHSLFIDGSQSSIGGCCNCKASKGIIGSSTFCDPHPTPPWQGLSDDDVSLMAWNDCRVVWNNLNSRKCWIEGYKTGAKWAEQALKEKNT